MTRTILGEYRSLSSSLCSFLHSPLPHPSSVHIFSSTPYSQTPSAYVPPSKSATKFHTHTKHQDIYIYIYIYLFILAKGCIDHDKWVPVTTAWRVLSLRMEELLSIWIVAANILNKQSRTVEKWWSSSLGFRRGSLSSSTNQPYEFNTFVTEQQKIRRPSIDPLSSNEIYRTYAFIKTLVH